ncbi:MAG: putative Ig domain-containing protein [Cyanobacteria bacterium SBLK]|nr:putative Ig domain-containing protein [Cyanobacteria bacterium SBLK]
MVYELLVAPEGMSIDENGLIQWQTTVEDVGTQTVVVRASDKRGGEDLQTFTLSVVDNVPNRPPIITSTPEVDGNINVLYTYNTVASDPDGDSPLIYSLETFPEGMAIDSQGVISWIPNKDQLGIHEVIVKVDDDRGGKTEQIYTIRVEPEPGNNPPVIVSSPFTQFEIPGLANPADGDVTPIAIDLDLELGEVVQREVSLTLPTESLFPTVDVFLLFDHTGSFSTYAPTLTNGFPNLMEELQNELPSVDWGFGVGRFGDYAEVVPRNYGRAFILNQPIISSDTEGFDEAIEAALNRRNGYLEGGGDAPEALIEGLYQIATGAGFDGNNDGDTIDNGVAGSLSAQLTKSSNGDIPAFDTFVADPSNNILTPSGTLGGAGFRQGTLPIVLAATDEGTVWQPDGLDTITGVGGVTLPLEDLTQDGRGSTPGGKGASIQPTIDALNDLGALTIGLGTGTNENRDPRLVLESLATLTGAINGSNDSIESGIIGDPIDPGDPLYFTVQTTNLADRVTAAIQTAVTAVDVDIDLVASDASGSFTNLTGIIGGVGTGDTVNFTTQFVGDGTAQSFDLHFLRPGSNTLFGSIPVTINNDYIYPAKALDPDGDPITYSLESAPAEATIDPHTGKIAWEPTKAGEYEFIVAARDDRGGYTTQSYILNVTQGAINTPPQITTTEFPASAQVGREFSYQIAAEDEDGDRLTYYLVNPPAGMTIDRDTGEIAWIPEETEGENANISVKVLDGRGGEDNRTFNVEIAPPTPNREPQILSEPPLELASLAVGETYRYDAIARDEDADPIEYALVVQPKGMSVDTETGTIVWNPDLDQGGIHDVILRASDGRGGVDLQAFQVEVELPNRPPQFIATFPEDAVPQAGKTFYYHAEASDPDGDNLTYRVVSGENAQFVHRETGQADATEPWLQWTPTEEGRTEIAIEVRDGRGGVTTQTLTPEVFAPQTNRAPSILSSPSTRVRLGNTYFYNVVARDIDGDRLTYALSDESPSEMEIDGDGRILWTPTAEDFGFKTVEVIVSDGTTTTAQTWSIAVSDRAANNSPRITSTPETIADLEGVYQYRLSAEDPENDLLLWSLSEAPIGMEIHPETGVLTWQPQAEQIGEQTVIVEVLDVAGASSVQEYTLTVRGMNTPPQIVSIPVTKGAVGEEYNYQLLAEDIDGDKLAYSPVNIPAGMTVDRETGAIAWTPDTTGTYEVEIQVTDDRGGVQTQKYAIDVGEQAINRPPKILSTPIYVGDRKETYTYAIEASDPDGDNLTYNPIALPSGMSLNGNILTWENPVVGEHQVIIGVKDGQTGAAQGFTLTVYDNQAPDIVGDAPNTAIVGEAYRYDVKATDPEGGKLTYHLKDAPTGMAIDEKGRIEWTPNNTNAGQSFSVTVEVEDEARATSQYTYSIAVGIDRELPQVKVKPLGTVYEVENGDEKEYQIEKTEQEEISFQALATDNEGVESLQVFINDVPVIADGNGVVTATVEAVGSVIAVRAVATDKAGNQNDGSFEVKVVDTLTPNQLVVELNDIPDEEIKEPVTITGKIDNDGQSVEYYLEAIPLYGGEPITIFTGMGEVEGDLGTFDPTLLPNDSYTLRLTAKANGQTSSVEKKVDVIGDLKLGNFQLSFTDLEVPLSGIPITVTRTYDSLHANEQDNFGYGWRLEFRDTNLQTSVNPPSEEQAILGHHNGFRDGDKVYITLPGGKREAFTFEGKAHHLGGFLTAPSGEGGWFYPTFVSEEDSELTLTVEDARLTLSPTGEYVGWNQVLYNPTHYSFGSIYTLTTTEGIEYEIDANTGDLLQVKDLNGNTLTYSDAGIVSSTGQEVKFERDAKGRIKTVIDPEGYEIQYEYDENGDLVKVIDRENNETEFFYENGDRPHYLTRIEDPLNRDGVRTAYNDDGRLEKVINVDGKEIKFDYDPDNFTQTVYDLFEKPTVYIYDDRGNVLEEIDHLGKKIKRTYNNNNDMLTETVITLEDDGDGNLVEVTRTYTLTYDDRGNLLTETDPLGNTYRYTYNNRNQILTGTDPLGNTTTFTYSKLGNLRSVTNAENHTAYFDCDLSGNLTSVKAEDRVTTFKYNEFGNRTHAIDALDNEVILTYDENGYVETRTTTLTNPITGEERTLISTKDYDNEGNLISLLNAENGLIEFDYDANQNLIALTDERDNVMAYGYNEQNSWSKTFLPDDTPNDLQDNLTVEFGNTIDSDGKLESVTDQLGNVTYSKYDPINQTVELILPDDTPNDLSDNSRQTSRYDMAGRLVSQTDERGNRIEYEYDDAGRQTLVRQFDGDRILETQTIYNKAGWVTATIDPSGRKVEYRYDKLGQVTETIFDDGQSIQIEYDAFGNATAYIDREQQKTQYEYDALNRLTAVIDREQQRTEYKYDEAGNLIEQWDANQHRTLYEYDGLGQRTAVVREMGQKATTKYDGAGNITEMTDFNGDTVVYQYDKQNRLISKTRSGETEPFVEYTYTDTGRLQSIQDDRGTTTYQYDERGFLESRTDPDTSTISYTYNNVGQVETITTPAGTVTYKYDHLGRLEGVIEGTETTTYEYDRSGNLEKTIYPNNVVETRTYDDLNRLTEIVTQDENETILSSYQYTLDTIGNRTAIEELGGRKVQWTYDDLDRLTKEEITDPIDGDRTIDYTYDKVGNRLSRKVTSTEGVVLTTYDYDDNDRLKSETKDGVTTRYTYDNNGNIILADVESSPEKVEYIWDVENRLQEIKKTNAQGATESVQYEYNALGVRVSSTQNGVTTKYLVDENRPYDQVLEEYTTEGANRETQATYTYGLNLLSQERGTDELFYLHDGHSGVRQLTDAIGTVTDTYSYDSYGNLLGTTGTSENNYLYQGEQYDPFAQMQYLRARYYDPDLGRFPSVDPFEGLLDQPMTLHRYLYANANPIMFNDPSGEFASAAPGIDLVLANAWASTLSAMQYAGATIGSIASTISPISASAVAIGLGMGAYMAGVIGTYFWRKHNDGVLWDGDLTLTTGTRGVLDTNIDPPLFPPGWGLPNFVKPGFVFSGTSTLTSGINQANVEVGGLGSSIYQLLKYVRGKSFAQAQYSVNLATLEENNPLAFNGIFLATNQRFLIMPKYLIDKSLTGSDTDTDNTSPLEDMQIRQRGFIGMGGGITGLGAVGMMSKDTQFIFGSGATLDTFDQVLLVGGSSATLISGASA